MTNEDENICFVCLEQNTENNNIKKKFVPDVIVLPTEIAYMTI